MTPTMVHDLASQAQVKYDPANIWPFRKWWGGRWGGGGGGRKSCSTPMHLPFILSSCFVYSLHLIIRNLIRLTTFQNTFTCSSLPSVSSPQTHTPPAWCSSDVTQSYLPCVRKLFTTEATSSFNTSKIDAFCFKYPPD